jgi:hypothetical protein
MESKKARWVSYVLTGLVLLFLFFDSLGKLLKVAPVLEGSTKLGYPESSIVGIGVVLLLCTILFAIPRTSVFGAILLTGYLGGAVATHVRVANPLLTHQLFPVYLGVLVWVALYLRNEKLRRLLSAFA